MSQKMKSHKKALLAATLAGLVGTAFVAHNAMADDDEAPVTKKVTTEKHVTKTHKSQKAAAHDGEKDKCSSKDGCDSKDGCEGKAKK